MGYDGAVDPTPYLDAWKHLQDVRFSNVAGWVAERASPTRHRSRRAILLQVSDISEASGLDPGSLQRAMSARGPRGQLLRALRWPAPLGLRPRRA